MAVAARFYVAEVTRRAWNAGALSVIMQPVTRGAENKSWAAATPTGKIELTIQNEAAATWFDDRLAKEVAITFEDRPELCVLCNEEVDGYGGNVGQEVSEYTVKELPQLKVGDVAHARCVGDALEAKK
jgi:hypothetical protein